jgi:hypothetical protein
MHSKIFQITRTRVDKDDYMNEDTLMQGDDSFFDYCAEIDDEERQYHIDNLVNNILPKGMFELVSDDTIRYNGGTMERRVCRRHSKQGGSHYPRKRTGMDWPGLSA